MVSKQVLVLNEPLSVHCVQAASVQSFSSIDRHAGAAERDGAGAAAPTVRLGCVVPFAHVVIGGPWLLIGTPCPM